MTETTLTERLARRGKWRLARAKNRHHKQKIKHQDTAIDLTFPVRLKPLAEKFYHQALNHPAFVYMTTSAIRQSIENRLWSIASQYPQWFGFGPLAKREATPAQLAALTAARATRTSEAQDRERRLNERIIDEARGRARAEADEAATPSNEG